MNVNSDEGLAKFAKFFDIHDKWEEKKNTLPSDESNICYKKFLMKHLMFEHSAEYPRMNCCEGNHRLMSLLLLGFGAAPASANGKIRPCTLTYHHFEVALRRTTDDIPEEFKRATAKDLALLQRTGRKNPNVASITINRDEYVENLFLRFNSDESELNIMLEVTCTFATVGSYNVNILYKILKAMSEQTSKDKLSSATRHPYSDMCRDIISMLVQYDKKSNRRANSFVRPPITNGNWSTLMTKATHRQKGQGPWNKNIVKKDKVWKLPTIFESGPFMDYIKNPLNKETRHRFWKSITFAGGTRTETRKFIHPKDQDNPLAPNEIRTLSVSWPFHIGVEDIIPKLPKVPKGEVMLTPITTVQYNAMMIFPPILLRFMYDSLGITAHELLTKNGGNDWHESLEFGLSFGFDTSTRMFQQLLKSKMPEVNFYSSLKNNPIPTYISEAVSLTWIIISLLIFRRDGVNAKETITQFFDSIKLSIQASQVKHSHTFREYLRTHL